MTAAGQSALNIRGLDTVVIYDARYANVVERGRNVLTRLYLGANEILQMAGRVHGRVDAGEVYILSDRDLVFEQLVPTPPEFQLAGDAERVAITCAALGVDARDLDLPVPLDRKAYRDAVELLTRRGLVEHGRLTRYGRDVEAMPVERAWGELLYHADAELIPMVAVAANIESLHRMTREERDLRGLTVSGSDHLTAYNVYAEAVNKHGYAGEVYGLPRHLFRETVDAWAEGRGVLVKAIEDVALGTASVYRQLELPLPGPFPAELADAARTALVEALLAGDAPHPDQGRLRRALERLGFYWRRSGGRLAGTATEQLAALLGTQLARVGSWEDFLGTRLTLDVDAMIPEDERRALEALPSSVHLYGDRVPVDYEVERGVGVVRLRLKEGQARRLQPSDVPPFDRPVRFTVLRGKREALRSDSLDELRRGLSGLSRGERQRLVRGGRRGRRR